MDKNTIIEVLELFNKGRIDNKGIQVIQEYCLEHNKPVDKTFEYLQIIQMLPNGIQGCLLDALNYYKNKFEILELKDKENKTIKYY